MNKIVTAKKCSDAEAFNFGCFCALAKMSVHANPFRNLQGFDSQWEQWNSGWSSINSESECSQQKMGKKT